MPAPRRDLNHGAMGRRSELFCPRCDDTVRALAPWPGWKTLWNVWKVGFAVVIVCAPLLASDFCVMLPCTMMYLTAGGLLRGYARQKPVCNKCSLELEPQAPGAATIRPRPQA